MTEEKAIEVLSKTHPIKDEIDEAYLGYVLAHIETWSD